jgi:hypothetical protein
VLTDELIYRLPQPTWEKSVRCCPAGAQRWVWGRSDAVAGAYAGAEAESLSSSREAAPKWWTALLFSWVLAHLACPGVFSGHARITLVPSIRVCT